ncbi:hypothetical protein Sbal223_0383 [Shewanella baltica OS223]|nr:hypothetical protein Sbal223_0383 [Shewanella baltica OS223]
MEIVNQYLKLLQFFSHIYHIFAVTNLRHNKAAGGLNATSCFLLLVFN